MSIEYVYLLGCWLFYMGGRNDRFKSGGKWLPRHIPGWAIRDWLAGFFLTISVAQIDLGTLLLLIASVASFYVWFRIGYGWEKYADNKAMDFHRPAWYIWRPVQILPGVLLGFLLRFM